ncbi:sigma-70 family RNA polymerase sigma factor [Isoptericola sp. NEAU-Y5]|uniref:Sigma-70 family RNA polymerase sigma factor n=1 Tax=Isoptericola luteus TaxID=2879484 RepID=A0ABS7ZA32_9MICO|nr:sigma-70 family RNA polymerase sigma factor [Isoptericola sp. NEAU-Y5]MCA5891910.1 sigma-70 family RNA polymerase sigma factor [Isoptericola sp. NEAU-Y5]
MTADLLAEQFETYRPHLRTVAYRVLGSGADADDAVQEAWVRAHGAGADGVENLGGWLTTIVGRVALNLLRARTSRRETAWATGEERWGDRVPDPVLAADVVAPAGPEQRAVTSDELADALVVVLDALTPAERVAFVLHDQFSVPFEDVAPIVGESVAATRQLASRARRKVRDATPQQDDLARRREVVAAYLAASQAGDFDALLALLDPEVVVRVDYGPGAAARWVRGARAVADQAALHFGTAAFSRRVLVNGSPGLVTVLDDGSVFSVLAFSVRDGRVSGIDILSDRDRLRVHDGSVPQD